MSKPRAHRAAAKAKRDMGRKIIRHQQAHAWFADWLQRASVQDTAESYQRDAIADANSGTDEMNNRRVN